MAPVPKKGAKKKKWSKGKVKDKVTHAILFDKTTYARLLDEVPRMTVITPGAVSEKLKINLSLARRGIDELENKGAIRLVSKSNHLRIHSKLQKVEPPKKEKEEKAEEEAPAEE